MTKLYRKPVNKNASARRFRNQTRRTKHINLGPQRGGWRL